MSKTHANRLVEAAEVTEILAPIGVIPPNEAQARELAPLKDQPEFSGSIKRAGRRGESRSSAHWKSPRRAITTC